MVVAEEVWLGVVLHPVKQILMTFFARGMQELLDQMFDVYE
jgi:hypothetical protein